MWALLAGSDTFCIFKHHRNTFFQVNTFSFCRMPVPEKVSDQSMVTQLCRKPFSKPVWQGFCPCVLPHVLWLVFQSVQRKTAAFHAEGIWVEFLRSCKQCDFSHMNFGNSHKGARHVFLSVQRCNKVMNKSYNERLRKTWVDFFPLHKGLMRHSRSREII